MTKPTVLKELIIGIIFSGIFFLLLGIIVMRPYYIFALGMLAGCTGAVLWVYNIYDTLDKSLDMTSKGAKSFMLTRSILRLLVVVAMMIIAVIIHWTAFVGVVIGLLGLKISALINPLVKRFMRNK